MINKRQLRYQKGQRIANRFLVHQALMGGMGEVYLCLDEQTITPYALKTFQQRFDAPGLKEAFFEEVGHWVALEKHPNIVRCHFMDIVDRTPFMFLEWVVGDESRGTSLRDWLRRGLLDDKTALGLIIDILRGLHHAQVKQPGIVHRDLKPENVLVTQAWQAKITDFGLATVSHHSQLGIDTKSSEEVDPRRTVSLQGGIVGTPLYMAPEQWNSEKQLDERTDLYAVGCILYELLTGSFVYTSGTLTGLRDAHCTAPLPNFTTIAWAAAFLQCCLAKNVSERFGTIQEALVASESLYEIQCGVTAHPASQAGIMTAADYGNRGLTYHELGRCNEALTDYTHAIELDPALAQAYYNRGITYKALGYREEALNDYTRAIELNHTLAQAYANRGLTYHELGRYNEALTDYARAIELNPTYALAYANRGNTYKALGHREEALNDYSRAVELDAVYAKAYGNRGIELDPAFAQVYSNRGAAYATLGRLEEALTDYNRAIELDPAFALAYYDRGVTYTALGRLDAALVDYSRAIELNPTDAKAYNERGVVHNALGRLEKALVDYSRAIELDLAYTLAYYNRGVVFAKLGRQEEALIDYSRAIELAPSFALPYSNRGNTHYRLGRHDEALSDYRRAVDLDPTFAQPYVNIGMLYANTNRLQQALPYFEKAAALGEPAGTQYATRARQMLKKT